jgi:hypothetical protein
MWRAAHKDMPARFIERVWHELVLAVQDGHEGVPAMGNRDVCEILAEWRTAERELDATAADDEREEIEGRIAALRDEYAAAMAAKAAVATELSGREPEPAGV